MFSGLSKQFSGDPFRRASRWHVRDPLRRVALGYRVHFLRARQSSPRPWHLRPLPSARSRDRRPREAHPYLVLSTSSLVPDTSPTGRPDLTSVLTKLHAFRLTEYAKLIFLDADVLPLQPISHLFATPHEFSASPDVGWPDIFNSGMFVFEPGEGKFKDLMELARSKGSWDGGDQGLLNEWRGNNWNRISFTYNTTPTSAYT